MYRVEALYKSTTFTFTELETRFVTRTCVYPVPFTETKRFCSFVNFARVNYMDKLQSSECCGMDGLLSNTGSSRHMYQRPKANQRSCPLLKRQQMKISHLSTDNALRRLVFEPQEQISIFLGVFS